MNDGEPGAAGAMSLSILIFVLLLVAWIATGALSALVRVHRMRRDGVIGEDQSAPAASLDEQLRPALVALSLAYLGAVGAAAALLPRAWSEWGLAATAPALLSGYVILAALLLPLLAPLAPIVFRITQARPLTTAGMTRR